VPTYAFQARTREGKALKGVRAAASEAALALDLSAESAFLVKAVSVGDAGTRDAAGRGRIRIKRKELAAFMLHVASYVEAGVPIMAALQDYRVPDNPALDAAFQDIRRRIEGGSSLSEAMGAYPAIFKPLQVSMVRAGEGAGRLDESIREVIKLVEWEEAFAAQVKQASTYPIIVLALIGLIVVLVSIFALPAILKLLQDFHVELPLVTRIFMAMGGFLMQYGWALILLPVLLYVGARFALRDPAIRLSYDTAVLGIPVIGQLVTKMSLSRFANFFAAQYRSGIPIIRLLHECEGVVGNARLALCVRQIRQGVERGERLAIMAAGVGYFPQLVVRMLAIGEEAGNLEVTLGKVSLYFDAEVQASIKRLFAVLEPLLMIFLATVLVFVAVSILLPIYTLIGGINAGVR
jgi:type II secretory pathway component PulF